MCHRTIWSWMMTVFRFFLLPPEVADERDAHTAAGRAAVSCL
jgi:hypothetical protein